MAYFAQHLPRLNWKEPGFEKNESLNCWLWGKKKSKINAERNSHKIFHCKSLTLFPTARMAFYDTTAENFATKMFNEIPPEENYLWDFLSLLRSLLKYQSSTIANEILWGAFQQMPIPSPNMSEASPRSEALDFKYTANVSMTPKYTALFPIIPW